VLDEGAGDDGHGAAGADLSVACACACLGPAACSACFLRGCSREMEAKVRNLRMELRDKNKEYDKTEDDLKALQSVGRVAAAA